MVDAKTEIENIQGYRAITVTLSDGTSEELHIKKLNVYELQTYAMAYGDQGKTVELFCSKEPKWASNLSYDDVERILDIGVEINDPILIRFSERDGQILQRMIKVLSTQSGKRRELASLLDGSALKLDALQGNPPTK
jgi:hypothetical protein